MKNAFKKKYLKRKESPSLAFAVPALFLYTFLLIIPIMIAFGFSFTSWNGFITAPMEFTGLGNYLRTFQDERLLQALKVTLLITVVVAFVDNIVGLLFALLLNKGSKLVTFTRTVVFAPYVISGVAVSFIWLSILSYTGALNNVFAGLGLENLIQNYFATSGRSLAIICFVSIWKTIGFHMVIYLAALQTVPTELYEACTVDGGNAWHKFRYVTLPMIRHGITINVLMCMINTLKVYDVIKVMTDGGPGTSTQSITYYIIQRAFTNDKLGYGSAIAVELFLFISLLAVIWIRLSDKKED